MNQRPKKRMKKLMSAALSLLMVLSMPVSGLAAEQGPAAASTQTTRTADDLLLYPAPRSLEKGEGTYVLQDGVIRSDDAELAAVSKIIEDARELAGVTLNSEDSASAQIELNHDEALDEQGYSLIIDASGVHITYRDEAGARYAAATLYQIMWQTKQELPYLTIENDHPDFQYRAFDMDISRNRLPSVDTVKRVIDLLEDLKYNQMFLYLEGFSYAYESYPQVWSGGDPLTPAQARELSEYAAERGIDLIPAQNSFGHSAQWIAHNDFSELGDAKGSTTLNLFDPDTQTFISNLYHDLYAEGFQSDILQVGGDETTLDLANGRAAASWRELHPGEEPTQEKLYMDSMEIIAQLAEEQQKTMMYWGDMIIHYDLYEEAAQRMPGAIAMNWGYLYDYDFETSSARLQEAGIPYYVCAGDASWSTITGNTFVMNKNAENAAAAGKKHEALGFAMTNWGDAGHYQNIITTYPAIVYGGGLSWCQETNQKEQNSYDEYLNLFLYQDSTNTLSQAFSELADFSNTYLPYGWNGNWIANCMIESWTDTTHNLWDFMDFQENGKDNVITESVRDMALEQCRQVADAAQRFLAQLEQTDIQADDRDILYKEFRNTAQMTKIAADYAAMRLRLFTGGEITTPLSQKEDEVEKAIASAQEFEEMIAEFKKIWLARDVYGELPSTLGWISKPSMMYRDIAGVNQIYQPQEDGNLFLKTPQTIGTDLAVDDFVVNGWTWTNYGTGMPGIANTYMGAESVGQLRNALKSGVFSIAESETQLGTMVFAYDSAAAIAGGFYENNPQWGPLLPRCGWPALIPEDGTYVLHAKLKFASGREINGGTVALSGSANRISDGSLMDVPSNPAWTITPPDEEGWTEITVRFDVADAEAASLGILPQNNVQDDVLYISDLSLRQEKPPVTISSDHPAYNVITQGEVFTVPSAVSDGKYPVEVTLQRPDGTQEAVAMGDLITAQQTGVYRLIYTAEDADNTLQIVFEVREYTDNLFLINDENASGFMPVNQFFALMNPYYAGNPGFNTEAKLMAYGSDTLQPEQYASLNTDTEGGNGQVIHLDTRKLSGNNRVTSINFSAEIEPGKTYHLRARMKYWRGEMGQGMDLGPFQTAVTFFNREITDQANEQWGGYRYIQDDLDDEQRQKAASGEWFTYDYTFTVPQEVLINGEQRTPTAMNVFFMTSSNDSDQDQHQMWIDDVELVEVKEEDSASEAAVQALRNMVDKAIALGSDDAALNEAITNAQAVLAKEAPTTTEVVTALLDLSEAMQALNADESEDALRKDVQATIDFIKENILTNVDNVRPGKVQALKDAVTAAQTVVDDPDATADELKAANKAMTKAAQELWEIVSKAELDALIEAAKGYLDGDYTAESLEALQAAIDAAKAVAGNDDATTAEVTQAITNLSDAIANLEKITLDTSALEHEIELVNEMLANIGNYVPSSVEGLQEKLDAAKAALENAASQAEIDEAAKSLREARLNARTKADVSALEELIAYVNSLDLRAYTAESADSVLVLADRALAKMNDPQITQEEVDALAEELQSAIDALQLVSEENVTTPDNGTASDPTNTAASNMSGMMIALMAAAGAAAIAAYRRKRS